MLQQTQVETVIPYYERFLETFPSVEHLADAPLDSVLGLWAGLGYYSRARNLKAAAEEVVERFSGRVPRALDDLQSLPGIGRYTAGAIASIAYDDPAPIVDGNVARVFSRFLALRNPTAERETQTRLWNEAARWARGPRPGDLNQALMELGARVCTPRAPECERCPLRAGCAALALGEPEAFPVPKAKRPPKAETRVAAFLFRRGRALALQRPAEGPLGGLWELPGGASDAANARAVATFLEAQIGLRPKALRPIGRFPYAFTHRKLDVAVWSGELGAGRIARHEHSAHRFVASGRFPQLPCATYTQRALELAKDCDE